MTSEFEFLSFHSFHFLILRFGISGFHLIVRSTMSRALDLSRAEQDDQVVSYLTVRSTMASGFKFLGRVNHDTGIFGLYLIVRDGTNCFTGICPCDIVYSLCLHSAWPVDLHSSSDRFGYNLFLYGYKIHRHHFVTTPAAEIGTVFVWRGNTIPWWYGQSHSTVGEFTAF